MKRIDAIIKGLKLSEKLFGLKKRKINRAIEAVRDHVEKQKEDATLAYEGLFSSMADDDANYQDIIYRMLNHKQIILNANATIEVLKTIEDDLYSEVEVDTV